MVILSFLSGIVLLVLCIFLIRIRHFDVTTIIALALKISAGFCLGVLYKYHYGGGDTFQYYNEAATIANFLWENPDLFFDIYFNTTELPQLSGLIVFYEQPRALLFSKIVSVFYIFSGGNYWIISTFLSFINFLGAYFLVTELNKKFQNIKTPTLISFYFLPTFVFWTSGLLKESLALSAVMIAIGIVIRFSQNREFLSIKYWIILILSMLLLWELKYFYAAVLIPVIASLLIYNFLDKYKTWRLSIMVIVFILGIFLMTNLHYNLNLSHVLNVVYENYKTGVESTSGKSILYYHFNGTSYGFLLNFPLALFSGLFRPMVIEGGNLFQLMVAMENLIIFGALIFALWKSRLRISFKNPFIISTLIYVVSLATFLAFSTPNLGTLSRYKVGYWPFFVVLVLILFFKQQKRPGPFRA